MKVSVIIGTRPEAIKLAPIIIHLRNQPNVQCRVCITGQHREMLDQVLKIFDIHVHMDFSLMEPNQSLGRLTARAIEAIDQYLRVEKPNLVIVQGDTTTVLCASLAAFYNRVPIAHVEAGLRTGDIRAPWPEEANRVLTTRVADLHFAPTVSARANLVREGVPGDKIEVTGNTVIDALFIALNQIRQTPPVIPELPPNLQPGAIASKMRRMILITGHRRENFGAGFESICHAISTLAARFPEVDFVYPVHLNPNVQEPVNRILRNSRRKTRNLHLIAPQPYLPFVALMEQSHIILTDSGGVQEEAPSLGKPVLVMRDATERPEAVEAGTVRLVGTDARRIINEVAGLLTSDHAYRAMSLLQNPYGDGNAAERIVRRCIRDYHD